MSTVTISREIRIPAPPAVVWSVLATPSQQSVVDQRVRLISEWGEPGTVDSGYELSMRGRLPMRLHVTDAVAGERHVVAIEWNGRTRGSQEAHLEPDGVGCVLMYTMSIEVPLGLRSLQRIYGEKRLGKWLDAVARVSTAVGE
ncbi:SRPBCC family protein [Nocardioides marmoriginsengisoli]|uniref:SRPBCC family protein n=1 Tax=Nocardioides marmoriginsengisoli TaxID=661483 RepID=A0A3N0CQJ6_9ACTN|nr:SRPBCC family protein [Nocardioides marmoriginsengisoli]RNL65724.1 SRPBCC family protein [Nocardioides marmoriginsengisoli]